MSNHSCFQRIAIVGLPGSGKSTFAEKLGKVLNIPVHHLDRHQFEPGGKKRDRAEFLGIQEALVKEPKWIIEGCSTSTFELRYAKADTFIYFCLPRWVCYFRLLRRIFDYKADFGGLRKIPWELIQYIWQFKRKNKDKIDGLRRKYPNVLFLIFHKQSEADQFLKSFVI